MSKKAVNAPSADPRRSSPTSPTTISASAGNSIEKPRPINSAPASAPSSVCAKAMIASPAASKRAAPVAVARGPARSGSGLRTMRLRNTAAANTVNTLAPPLTPWELRSSTTKPARAA